MALKRISVVVLICFLSFADADAEFCAHGDVERAKQMCGRQALCITINGEPTKSYKYSKEMSVTVECHYAGEAREQFVDNFTIKLNNKNTGDTINKTKCRNLKTEIRLFPHTNNVFYTCEHYDHSKYHINAPYKHIEFIYVPNQPISSSTPKPRTTTRPAIRQTPTPSSKPPEIVTTKSNKEDKTREYNATIKVTVNGGNVGNVTSKFPSGQNFSVSEAEYYYFYHEMVNITCALVISDHNSKSYFLAAHNNERCIDGNSNGTRISHTQELTDSVSELNYQCNLWIGKKTEGKTCVIEEKRALFTLKFKYAKLMMYIDDKVKEKETTENGSEIVYTYNQEDITVTVKCTHAPEVYNRRHISQSAIIWETKQLDRTFKNNLTYHKDLNKIKIPLFADQSNSYLDCVEHLENPVSINKESQPTRIRLRFIYAKLRMYINNNNVTEEQTTTNGSEVVYKYKKENVTVVASCSHGAEVYRIHRYNMSHTPIKWITEKLDSTYKNNDKNITLIKENYIKIRLFADQNESYVDCVDNLNITSAQNSKIRLKFIYEKDEEVISMSDPKDAEPDKKHDQKDAEAMNPCDPEDAERAKVCGQKEMCITINNKTVTSYNYSQEMDITVVCHYNGWGIPPIDDDNFTIHLKKGDDVISDEEKCRNLEKVIHLSPDTNKTVYTCEKYSNGEYPIDNKTMNITFLYVPEEHLHNDTTKGNQTTEENLTMNGQLKFFFESHWIVLTAGLVLFIVVIAVIVAIWVVLKSRKRTKEDKRRLNPKGSRESLEDIPKQHKEMRSVPKLNEQYTDLDDVTVSEVYSDPYSAMYTQPIPKSARITKVLPNLPPKPKPRNVENYSNTSGLVYEEPSTYNNITGATYNNIVKNSKNTGATYNNIVKNSKNTGATYNNIGKSSKHTGTTYNNIDKSLKNSQRVLFYDNIAAGYSNTENEKWTSDVYSEPGLYEEPS